MTVTFFGHKQTPPEVKHKLRAVLIDVIENHGANVFYVGNQGMFDSMVRSTLKELSEIYPHIRYMVVLAYMPDPKDTVYRIDYSDTIYPEGLEFVPRKFAISRRNRWMIDQSDMVITYVLGPCGGAATSKNLAEKKGKLIINIANM